MIFERIDILNFGPYYDQHKLIFGNNGYGVHLIRGGNGQGKTSLQRAVLWCLYGEIKDRKGNNIPLTSLLNHTAKNNGMFQFGVDLYFSHDGKNWRIHRVTQASKHTNKRYQDNMDFSVYKDGKPVINGEKEIPHLLPKEVSRFFVFDGEMLRDFEDLLDNESRSMNLLRNSVERVLGVPYLKTGREDIKRIKNKFETERNRLIKNLGGKEIEELVDELNDINHHIEATEETISNLEEQQSKLSDNITSMKRELEDHKEVQSLAEDQNRIDGEIKVLTEKLNTAQIVRNESIKDFYKVVLLPLGEKIIETYEEKHKKHMEKYDKKKIAEAEMSLLQNSLNEQVCSQCGTVLNEEKKLEIEDSIKKKIIEIEELTEIPQPNLKYETNKNRLKQLRNVKINKKVMEDYDKTINELSYQIEEKNSELKTIQDQLEGVDVEAPRELQKTINSSLMELGRIGGLLDDGREDLIEYKEMKNLRERKVDSFPQEQIQEIIKRIELLNRLYSIFDSAITKYRDEKKIKVEEEATKIFRTIITKEAFDHLKINDNYGLSIITKQGNILNRSEWRSSGEEQIIALSLIGALSECAQINAPIIMDTPFARFDMTHGEKILEYVPKMSDQIILLVTDREFRPGDERYIAKSIHSDYRVLHIGETEGSKIIPNEEGIAYE